MRMITIEDKALLHSAIENCKQVEKICKVMLKNNYVDANYIGSVIEMFGIKLGDFELKGELYKRGVKNGKK